MTVRVGGIFTVDGSEIQILCEGGSAKEAYAALLGYAEELGGVVAPPENAANGADKKQRNRRTKAEMDAARTAAVDGGSAAPPRQPTPDLPGPAAPAAPMSAFSTAPPTVVTGGPGATVSAPFTPVGEPYPMGSLPPGPYPTDPIPGVPSIGVRPGDWAPPAGPPVGFTDDPRAPQDGKAVGFDGPPPLADVSFGAPPPAPPPLMSEADLLRDQINAAVERTVALQPAWENSVRQALDKALEGRQFALMHSDDLRRVLGAVEDYERRVKEALAQRR